MDVDIIRELSAVPLASLAVYLMYRLATNHMNSLATAVDKLAEAIDELKTWISQSPRRK